jgi:hypothetical protein
MPATSEPTLKLIGHWQQPWLTFRSAWQPQKAGSSHTVEQVVSATILSVINFIIVISTSQAGGKKHQAPILGIWRTSSTILQTQAGQIFDEWKKLWYIVSRNWGRGVVVNMSACQAEDRGFESRGTRVK